MSPARERCGLGDAPKIEVMAAGFGVGTKWVYHWKVQLRGEVLGAAIILATAVAYFLTIAWPCGLRTSKRTVAACARPCWLNQVAKGIAAEARTKSLRLKSMPVSFGSDVCRMIALRCADVKR